MAMLEPCSPVPDPNQVGLFICDAPDREPWSFRAEAEVGVYDQPTVREMVQVLQGVLQDHDAIHEQAHPRPVRNAKPKFGAGLGMTPGTKITHLANNPG